MSTFTMPSKDVVVAWPQESDKPGWPKHYLGKPQALVALSKLPNPELYEVWRPISGRSYYLRVKLA